MNPNQHESSPKTPEKRSTFSYLCYRCNQPGHFIRDCPETTPKRSPISQPSSSSSDPEFPATYCHCGAGICGIHVSGSFKNPGRKYYRCPGKYEKNCGYFKWCDEVKHGGVRECQPELNFPICGCGAGVCTVMVEDSGPHSGRKYFACPIKRGDGACNFRQWLDDFPHSALIDPKDAATEHDILLDDFKLTYEETMQIDALERAIYRPPLENVRTESATCEEGDTMTDPINEPSTEIDPHPVHKCASQSTIHTTQSTTDSAGAMENMQTPVQNHDSQNTLHTTPVVAAQGMQTPVQNHDFELTYEESMQIDALERAIYGPPLENVRTESAAREEGDTMADPINEPSTDIDPHPVQNCASQSTLHTTQSTTDSAGAMENMQTPVQNHDSQNTLHTTPVVAAQGNSEPSLELVQTEMAGSERDGMTDQIAEPSVETDPYLVHKYVSENTLHSEVTTQSTIDDDVATLHNSSAQDHLLDLLLHFLKGHLFKKPGSPGRALDTPPRMTVSEMSPVVKGNFPRFDQVTMQKDNISTASVILEDSSEEGYEASPGLDNQPWSGLLLNPSGLLKDGLSEGSSMASTILHTFEKSAHHIRNKLITLLDSMDPRDHETMSKEAGCTFAALDLLQVDYGLFHMKVTEYINQATALARLKKCTDEDSLDQELIRGYISKKSCYAEARDAYLRANDAYKTSSEKLSLLHKKASRFRDMMGEVEKELTWCKEENVRHRDNVEQTKKTLLECQTVLHAAYRDALEPLERHEKREIEKTAAKAAFERARAQLRQ